MGAAAGCCSLCLPPAGVQATAKSLSTSQIQPTTTKPTPTDTNRDPITPTHKQKVREAVAAGGGIRGIVDAMSAHADDDGLVCNACLALMSLVRGESEVCQSNQWHIAKAGAVEAAAAAMRRFAGSAMVQLSVLLAFIPLALENAMMQAHITQVGGRRRLVAVSFVCWGEGRWVGPGCHWLSVT